MTFSCRVQLTTAYLYWCYDDELPIDMLHLAGELRKRERLNTLISISDKLLLPFPLERTSAITAAIASTIVWREVGSLALGQFAEDRDIAQNQGRCAAIASSTGMPKPS